MTTRNLGWDSRVGALEQVTSNRYKTPVVFVYSGGAEGVRINMSPDEARVLSRQLKRWADAAAPLPVRKR